MLLHLRFVAATLLVVLSITATPALAENVHEKVREFALDRFKDGQRLVTGPSEIPLPAINPDTSCIDLYERRITLRRHLHDYKPPYWDDPRNQAAVFIGTIWAPAFYFLGYSAINAHLEQLDDLAPQTELEALSRASAQQRCFEK